jgi:hypothetical protein
MRKHGQGPGRGGQSGCPALRGGDRDRLAIAEYRLGDGTITFTHTLVPPELGGRGIGKALVRAGLAAARERGLKVIPLCSFVARHFADHAEARDLLEADSRRVPGGQYRA